MPTRVQSPSSINTFKQCKRKYYYNYIEKIPTLSNIHQVRGNIAHSCLEDFFDIDAASCSGETMEFFFRESVQKLLIFHWTSKYKDRLEKLDLSDDRKKFYFEETMLMLMNWVSQFIRRMREVMESKNMDVGGAFAYLTPLRELEYRSEQWKVRGFIDAIHKVEDEVHIIDYKTNSRFDFKDSIKLQLGIYCLLYQEKHGEMPDKVGVSFLRNTRKMMNVDQELIELAKREVELIHGHTEEFSEVSDYPRTVTGLCKWKTGQCDFYGTCKPHD